MRNPTLIIEKTLGKLREIYITNDLVKGREDAISRFSAEKETLSIWQDYGQYNEDRLTITHDGKTDNIVMDGFVISPVVKDTHFFSKRLHDDVLHISKKPLRGELSGFLSIYQAEASCISPKVY